MLAPNEIERHDGAPRKVAAVSRASRSIRSLS